MKTKDFRVNPSQEMVFDAEQSIGATIPSNSRGWIEKREC